MAQSIEKLPIRDVNLHPNDHLPSNVETKQYDVIVIGSGPAGRTATSRVRSQGLTAVIIENELFGGDCVYWACMPSKGLLRPGEALESANTVGGARERVSNPEVDVDAVFARRDGFAFNWDDQFLVDISEADNVTVLRGNGKIQGVKKVAVQEHATGRIVNLEANHAVIVATGSDAVIPDIPGLLEANPWTPRQAISSNHVPEHLIIVGAGVVGSEVATAYAGFGKKVTLISSTDEILPRSEPEAGKMVRESLRSRGVDVRLSTRVVSVTNGGTEQATVQLSSGDHVSGTKILIATGRQARTSNIGLESVQIKGDGAALEVDDSMCVTDAAGNWLYAIGDANMRAPLTHMGAYHGRTAADAIAARAKGVTVSASAWSKYSASADYGCIPQVIVTNPNVATVGLTLAQAKESGKSVKEVSTSFAFPGAWLYGDNYEGWARWVVDTETNLLLGATFVGREAADLLHPSTVAIAGQVPLDRLAHAVASFPTRSQIYTRLQDAGGL